MAEEILRREGNNILNEAGENVARFEANNIIKLGAGGGLGEVKSFTYEGNGTNIVFPEVPKLVLSMETFSEFHIKHMPFYFHDGRVDNLMMYESGSAPGYYDIEGNVATPHGFADSRGSLIRVGLTVTVYYM